MILIVTKINKIHFLVLVEHPQQKDLNSSKVK